MAIDWNDPEAKAALDAAVETAVAGLQNKNKELILELREAKKGRTVDPSELTKLEDQLEAITAERDGLSKQLKDNAKALEKATEAHKAESAFTTKLLMDNGLTAELVKAKVAAPLMSAAKALLASQVQIVADGAERRAMVGDKPLADFIAGWAASDEGKHFVLADQNAGGGAAGGSGGGGAAKMKNRAEFGAMSPADQSAFMREGGKVTD